MGKNSSHAFEAPQKFVHRRSLNGEEGGLAG